MAYDKVVDSSVLDAGLKAIADAIREKGGTSDNLAFPDAMAAAIAAIEAGGVAYQCGKITPSENTTQIEITHNLGDVPDIFLLTLKGVTSDSNAVSSILLMDGILFDSGVTSYVMYRVVGSGSSSSYRVGSTNLALSDVHTLDTTTIDMTVVNSNYFFGGSKNYYWYAFSGLI